jgi:uncharacterized membrane protein
MAKNNKISRINPQKPPQQQTIVASQQWSGPLPPPDALAKFNEIIPGGAERIVRMVELEQEHSINYENKKLDCYRRDIKRGHWIGLAVSIAAIGGSVYTAYIGAHPAVSIALVSVPVFSVVIKIIESIAKAK